MKICIVSDLYYPYPGGVSEHVHHSACELVKLGHNVSILTTNYDWLNSSFTGEYDKSINVIRIGRAQRFYINKSVGIIPMALDLEKQARSIIKENNFDVLHIHCPNSFIGMFAIKHSRAVNIATFHSASPKLSWHKYAAAVVEPYTKRLDGMIAVSEVALRTMKQSQTTKTVSAIPNITIIPNGVDTTKFSSVVKPIPELNKGNFFNILFVGRFEPRKGLDYLISAFQLVRKEIKSARLIVVGKGWLNDTVIKNNMEGINFVGFVEPALLPSYYASCHIFCSPATDRESFGIVLLEGMSAGACVIASNIEGYSQVVKDGEDGLLFEPKNPVVIADTIIKLYKEPELYNRLVTNGQQTALKYSWDKVTKEIEKFYYYVKENK
ncbi:MAG: glycosyltransferase family 4 protein [bacterium]|nr:glycosyltransferase family 4 protein [bacterium]